MMPILWKALAGLALAIAIAAVGYTFGHSSGYKAGFDAQQASINVLTDKINAERQAATDKITSLEQDSANAAAKLHTVETNNMQAKASIITKYQTQYVEGATKCALDNETVKAVNELIAVDTTAYDLYVANSHPDTSALTDETTKQPTKD